MIKHWNPDTDLTFDDILNFAQNNGYEICGNAYESELLFICRQMKRIILLRFWWRFAKFNLYIASSNPH